MGNKEFVASVNRHVGEVWRVRNVRDIVGALGPTLWGLLPYRHVFPGLQLGSDRDLRYGSLEKGFVVTWDEQTGGVFPERLLGDLKELSPEVVSEEKLANLRGIFKLRVSSHDLGVYLDNLEAVATQLRRVRG